MHSCLFNCFLLNSFIYASFVWVQNDFLLPWRMLAMYFLRFWSFQINTTFRKASEHLPVKYCIQTRHQFPSNIDRCQHFPEIGSVTVARGDCCYWKYLIENIIHPISICWFLLPGSGQFSLQFSDRTHIQFLSLSALLTFLFIYLFIFVGNWHI